MKFIPKYINPILNGKKTCTVRYGWNDDDLPLIGERILMTNSQNGITFADATCSWIDTMTIEEFVNETWEGHKEYESVDEMIWAMGHFYTESMNAETEVDVIGWKNVNSMYNEP